MCFEFERKIFLPLEHIPSCAAAAPMRFAN
jgi:hypothetical protein